MYRLQGGDGVRGTTVQQQGKEGMRYIGRRTAFRVPMEGEDRPKLLESDTVSSSSFDLAWAAGLGVPMGTPMGPPPAISLGLFAAAAGAFPPTSSFDLFRFQRDLSRRKSHPNNPCTTPHSHTTSFGHKLEIISS